MTAITPETPGEVELRGKVDNTAPLEIAGRINPLARDLFLDIKARANDIELPPLSPYSIKYAGYGIERGKLSVNVKYLVENRKLAAENNVYLDQLTFGEKVESPTATKLPVLLAVALLKDRNGVIDVNLPVGGSLDDPQFSVGGDHRPGDRQPDREGGHRAVRAARLDVRRRRQRSSPTSSSRPDRRSSTPPTRRSSSRSRRRSPSAPASSSTSPAASTRRPTARV